MPHMFSEIKILCNKLLLTNLCNLYSTCFKAMYSSVQYVQTFGGEEYAAAHRIILELASAKFYKTQIVISEI